MSQRQFSIFMILMGVALVWSANGLCFTLVALRMSSEQFATYEIGIVTTGYFIGQIIGAGFLGNVISKVGHIRAFAALASTVSAGVICYALYVDIFVWFLIRVLHGICIAGLLLVVESWLNGIVSNNYRGQLISIYVVTQSIAFSLGQQLLQVASPGEFILFALASMLFSVALLPLVLSSSVSVEITTPRALNLSQLFQLSPFGVVGSLVSGALSAILIGLMPVYLSKSGFSVSEIAIFMSCIFAGGLIIQYPIGKASDIFDRRTVFLVAMFIGGLLCGLSILLAPMSFYLFIGLTMIYSGIVFAIYPLSIAHVNDFLEAEQLVPASAGLILMMALGAALGPIITSFVMELIGEQGLLITCGCICILTGGFVGFRILARKVLPSHQQGPYQVVPKTTPASVVLDPRASDRN